MNILFCLDTTFNRKNGGIASVSMTLEKGLRERGHHCIMVSALKDQKEDIDNQYYLPESTVELENETNRTWYRNFIEEHKIDIVINQNGMTPHSIWPIAWCEGLTVKKITVYHGDFYSLWSCHKEKLNDNILVKMLSLRKPLDKVFRILFRLKYKKWLQYQICNSDRIVFLSSNYFDSYKWFSGIEIGGKHCAIYNPADDIFFNIGNEGSKRNTVLFVGRLSREKGLDKLLDIWSMVSPGHPDWELSIVGEGPMREYLERQAVKLNLKNVCFEGYNNPIPFYKHGRIVCITSSTEGFPLVLVEGMACGCAPITFNSYACAKDIIDDGVNGFLVKPFDINEYANRMSRLMEDGALYDSISKGAKEKSKTFSLNTILDQWECLFESVIEE